MAAWNLGHRPRADQWRYDNLGDDEGRLLGRMFRGISGCTEQAIVEASQNDKIGGSSQFKDRLASLIDSSASKFSLSALPILVNGSVNPKVATSLLSAYATRQLTFQADLVPALFGGDHSSDRSCHRACSSGG